MSHFEECDPPLLVDNLKAIHEKIGVGKISEDIPIAEETRRVGWRLILGKSPEGVEIYIEAVLPPNRIRRFLRWLLLGERWVKA